MDKFRFTLLGPLRAWHGEDELALGAKQQRLILALLLARAGEWVALSDLVDLLWGDDPPNSAVNVVHRYVGTLRRLFEPDLPRRAEGRWLAGDAGIYRINVTADTLDLLCFREHVARGRRASADGRPDEALDELVEALAGWRDRCAAGLDAALTTHPAFVALEEECTTVAREAARLALSRGRPSAALPGVQRSADRHPFDEALQAQLMLLLAADGKQADALMLFQHVGNLLDDQLGVNAGPELQTALQSVLRTTEQTGTSLASAAPVDGQRAPSAELHGWVRPAQLPSDHAFFAGRGEILDGLRQHGRRNASSVPVLGIDGIPGIGKTTLAIHLAHLLAQEFPDGQLYADLRGFDAHRQPMDPHDALQNFLSALGVTQTPGIDDVQARAGLYRSALSGRRVLILLDNAADVEQVRPLLPGSASCLVIVTSRSRLAPLDATIGAHLTTLDTPGPVEARDSFVHRIGAARADAESAALDEVIEQCGRLPLAMALVAARAADQPLATILTELKSARRSLDPFDDENLNNDLRAIFSWSYRRLSPVAARLFRLLSLHPGPDISVPSVTRLADVTERQARAQLTELIRTRLITQHRPHRYRLHLLVRTYAAELASEAGDEQDLARRRLHDYFQETSAAASRALDGSVTAPAGGGDGENADPGGTEAMEWFIAEHDVLRAIIEEAAARGEAGRVWRLALSMQLFYQRYCWWNEWRDVAQVALQAVLKTGDIEGRAQMERSLAGASFFLGHHEDALTLLRAAIKYFDQAGLVTESAQALMNLSRVLLDEGRYAEAVRHHRKAILLLQKHGLRRAEISALQVMANYLMAHRPRTAESLAGRAAQLCAELGDVRGSAICDELLARCALAQGRPAEALEHCRRGIERLRGTYDRITEAEAFTTLGDIFAATQNWDAAHDAWQKALSYYGDPRLSHAQDLTERLSRFTR